MERDDPAQANPTRFEWNHVHRLSRATLPDLSTAEYRDNADDLRTWRRAPSGAETHSDGVPDEVLGLSQVLNELDGTGARRADYVLGPDGRIAILDGDGNERYDLFDALGSVLAVGGPRMGSGSVFEGDGALTTVSGNEQGTPGRWNSPARQV